MDAPQLPPPPPSLPEPSPPPPGSPPSTSPPLLPPPSSPALEVTPDSVFKSESTIITLSDAVAPGSYVAFLVAGDTSCDGALAALSLDGDGDKAGGRLDDVRAISVALHEPLLHKLCVAPPSDNVPSGDAAFTLAESLLLEVVNRSPPSPAPPAAPASPTGILDASADLSAGCVNTEHWSLELATSLDQVIADGDGRLRSALAALLHVAEERVELPGVPREHEQGWGVVAELLLCDRDGADLESEQSALDASHTLDITHETHEGGPWNLTSDGEATIDAPVEKASLAATVIGAEWHLAFRARLRLEMGWDGQGRLLVYLGLIVAIVAWGVATLARKRFSTSDQHAGGARHDRVRAPQGTHRPNPAHACLDTPRDAAQTTPSGLPSTPEQPTSSRRGSSDSGSSRRGSTGAALSDLWVIMQRSDP